MALSVKSIRRLKITSITVASLTLVYTLLGFFVLPLVVEHYLVSITKDKTGHDVSVANVSVNPFTFELTVEQFFLSSPEQPAYLTFQQLQVNVAPTSIFSDAYEVQSVQLSSPEFTLELHEDGSTNLPQIKGSEPAQPGLESTDEAGVVLAVLSLVELLDGKVTIKDDIRQVTKEILIERLSLVNVSTVEQALADYLLLINTPEQEHISVKGKLQLQPFIETTGNLSAADISLPDYHPFFKELYQGQLDKGRLSIMLPYDVSLQEGLTAELKNASVHLSNLQLSLGQQKLATLRQAAITGIHVLWPQQVVQVGAVFVSGGDIKATRSEAGVINWLGLIKPSKTPVEKKGVGNELTRSSVLSLLLAQLTLEKSVLQFNDRSVSLEGINTQVNVDTFSLKNVALNADQPMPLSLSMQLNKTAKIQVKGVLQPTFDQVVANVVVNNLVLPEFGGYLQPYLNTDLVSGMVDVDFKVNNVIGSELPLLLGDVQIKQFDLKVRGEDKSLLTWDQLAINQIKVAQGIKEISVAEVVLEQPFADIEINSQAQLNLSKMIKPQLKATDHNEAQGSASGSANKAPSIFPVHVGEVKVVNGRMFFADYSLPIQFATKIHDLNGRVSELDSTSKVPAKLSLKGVINEYGSANIQAESTFFDLANHSTFDIQFKNLSLKNLTPYAAKFAGYRIEEGKLSLGLKYDIQKGQLAATNNVLLDNLTLGETFDSPDAPSLPLSLAISLLKDSDGKIELDLPVSGDLTAPEVSIGGIVGKALVSVITSVVTSPFRFIGNLVGFSGDDLSRLSFESGLSALTPPAKERLDALAKALAKRPQLKLEITGCFSEPTDQKALRDVLFEAELEAMLAGLKAQKNAVKNKQQLAMRKLYAKHYGVEAIDALELSHTKKGEGANLVLDEAAYYADMKQKLFETIILGEGALSKLATARASEILNYLKAHGKVTPNQLKLEEVEEGADQAGDVVCELDLTT
ncbi:MAG: DUF748 domain-containing protein [Methylococcales bacterium]|nr:DUF748 domain-containing protein [Methylococcales bacterium]